MAKQLIRLGTPNGNDGDIVRDAFAKVNDNFAELYGAIYLLGGSSSPTDIAEVNIKGDVISSTDVTLLDHNTGRLTISALPLHVPVVYELQVNFRDDGTVASVENIPDNWTYIINQNEISISYPSSHSLKTLSVWSETADNVYEVQQLSGVKVIKTSIGVSTLQLVLTAHQLNAIAPGRALISLLF